MKSPSRTDQLLHVADTVSTPTYVYHADIVRARCREFKAAIGGFSSRLLYAVKANSNPALLKIIQEEIDGLEVVSAGEVELALRLGIAPDRLLFSPNNIADDEMSYVADRGVLLNVGELSDWENCIQDQR